MKFNKEKKRERENASEETNFLWCLWLFGLLLKTEHMGKPRNNESAKTSPETTKGGGNDWSARPVQAALAAVLYAQGLLDDLDVVVVELEAK